HGARRGPDGRAGLPPRTAQDPVDARVQEPDDARDPRDHDAPRPDAGPGGPLRGEGGGAGAAPSRDPGGRERRLPRGRGPDRRGAHHPGEGPQGARPPGPGAAGPRRAGAAAERGLPRADPGASAVGRSGGAGGHRPACPMMRLPPFTYLGPTRVEEAARLLAEHGEDAMVVAGGTDLYLNMERRQFEPRVLGGLRGSPGPAASGGAGRDRPRP